MNDNYQRFIFPSPGFDYYWKKGNGKSQKKVLKSLPGLAEIEKEIPLLAQYDATMDAVVNDLFYNEGYQKANAIFQEAIKNPCKHFDNQALDALLQTVNNKPDWLRLDLLEQGAEFCRRVGPSGLLVLRNYCLMGGYESAAINKPLIKTGALKNGAAKRLTDTVDFWVKITGENALDIGGEGFQSVIKTRLYHAYARVSILKKSEWDNSKWGVPLNQWDMLATNLGFSTVFMDGLKKLGCKPTEEEYIAVLHFWKYVGFLLGIPAEILPNNRKEAISELYKWTITQPPADADTKTLAKHLLDEPLTAKFPTKKWQKAIARKYHLGLNNYFLGKKSCTAIGLPNALFRFIPYVQYVINSTVHTYGKLGPKSKLKISAWSRKKQVQIVQDFYGK